MATRKERQYRGTHCLNCDTALDISEKYCHQCGQLNSTKKLTIKDFFEEFLSNFYAYDSRLRNSFISIFTKPGVLAREYNAGRRQKYANPFRLFLSVSLMLFLFYGFDNEEFKNQEQEIVAIDPENIENANIQIDSINLPDTTVANVLKKSLSKIKKDTIRYSVDSIYTKNYIDEHIPTNFDPLKYRITSFRNYHLKFPDSTDVQCLQNLGFENNSINRFVFNKSKLFKSNDIYAELMEYFYKKLPFLIFLSLPIITIIFWIVYFRKKMNYTEHLVFAYTFFTFMFLCLILFKLMALVSENMSEIMTDFCFSLLFPFYLYKSLRNFYQQSRLKTIIKFVVLNPLFGIFLVLSAIIMLFVGIVLF